MCGNIDSAKVPYDPISKSSWVACARRSGKRSRSVGIVEPKTGEKNYETTRWVRMA